MEWTLYGKKYNLDDFLKRHPGGELALRLGQGRDCTRLFEQYHVLSEKHIRTLASFGESVDIGAVDAFYTELKEELRKLDGIHCTWRMAFVLGAIGLLNLWAWIGWFQGSWRWCLSVPILSWLFAVNIAHDAAHFAFSGIPAINSIASWFSSPLFYNTPFWYLQHNISHHVNTNDHSLDIDLYHNRNMVRSHHIHKWLPPHKYQVYTVASLNMMLTSISENILYPFEIFISDKLSKQFFGIKEPVLEHCRFQLIGQLGLSFFVLLYPFFAFSFLKGIVFATYPYMMASFIFITVTQISHIQEVTQRRLQGWRHWSHQMVDTALDYSQDSHVWTFLTGGLNCQGLHHCVPGLSSSRFVAFYPVYRSLCKKHGLQLHETKGFFEAIRLYWNYIILLSKDRVE